MNELRYPYPLLRNAVRCHPVVDVSGPPYHLELSDDASASAMLDPLDPEGFQAWLDGQMHPHHTWGVCDYLERRETLLRYFPQMVAEGRCFHLGLDIIVPEGTPIYAPIAGAVVDNGHEPGIGNYGGYLILAHLLPGAVPFYSFFGHLDPKHTVPTGTVVSAGDPVARTGGFDCNGRWFQHTHLQVITQNGMDAGFDRKGYCNAELLPVIQSLCPDPVPLFLSGLISQQWR